MNGLTILIVEDDKIIRENAGETLTLANYSTVLAENGKDGLQKIRQSKPDLIISDIGMPVLDGLGFLHILRQDPLTADIPFIFLTSNKDREVFRNAMDSGADDFITKPFNCNELLKAVENRFRRMMVLKKPGNTGTQIDTAHNLMPRQQRLDESIEGLDALLYRKKQIIYKEGQYPKHLFYVRKGKVRLYKTHEAGKQFVVNLYNEGNFFGYYALLEGTAYKESAEAIEDTELVLVPKKDFENVLRQNTGAQEEIIRLITKDITEKESWLVNVAYNSLRMKVADALRILQSKYHHDKSGPFAIDMSREDLASLAGVALESFVRVLSEFKNEKIIEVSADKKIRIIDPEKLAKLIR